jgi:quercetin dioxygenase-like cupin family protein
MSTPAWSAVAAVLAWTLSASTASAQLAPRCVENSPERRGGLGCSIIETKLLPADLREPLFWHIDRFDSAQRARAAVGAASIAFEAAGAWWLMTIESQTSEHHGGRHVAEVGPLELPRAARYAMQVNSATFAPGMYTLVHHHSGVEAFYVLEGEQCLATPTRAYTLRKGDTLALPAGIAMRLVATGSTVRRGVGIIVHDAAQPSTTAMEEGTGPQLVACK